MILGIDPGLSGGLAWLTHKGEIVDLRVMPTITHHVKRDIDEHALVALLSAYPVKLCTLEKAQSMPGQGLVSTFRYGTGYGILRGILATLDIPYILVGPQTWTSELHCGRQHTLKPKAKSLETAQDLFPQAKLIAQGCRKPHEGLVDALLIAEWGRRRVKDSEQRAS